MTWSLALCLVVLSASSALTLAAETYWEDTPEPLLLCLKSDFSMCSNVTYPTGCVNLNDVTIKATDKSAPDGDCTAKFTALRGIESVIVRDVDNDEDRCVAMFDEYNCQGQVLVLNGKSLLAVRLHDYGFANRAVSFRQCTDKLLAWVQDQPIHRDRLNGLATSYEGVPDVAEAKVTRGRNRHRVNHAPTKA